MATTIVWFRRDLRLADNPALAAAVGRGAVVPLFILDRRLLTGHSPRREARLLANLTALDAGLRRAGSGLLVRRGDPRDEVTRVAREARAEAVHWNRDYTPFARRRDAAVERACRDVGLEVAVFAGSVLVEPEALRALSGRFCSAFTPYYKAWAAVPARAPTAAPGRITGAPLLRGLELPGAGAMELPEPGEGAARARLGRFVRDRLARYKDGRDRMDVESTSRLSYYARFGLISPARSRLPSGRRYAVLGGWPPPPTPSCASWPGGNSSCRSCGTCPRACAPSCARTGRGSRGAATRPRSAPGRRDARVIRSWTRGCASWPPPASCTTGGAW